jgi:glycosyltransferase involved in cell wall biosynthesis
MDCIDAIDKSKYAVTCFYLEKDSLAPFDMTSYHHINFVLWENDGTPLDLEKYVDIHDLKIVFVAGWAIKSYNQGITKLSGNKIPVVLMMDTPWRISAKKIAFVLYFLLFRKRYYHYAWVPGSQQVKYASKLGFKPSEIGTGLYTTNTAIFNNANKVKTQDTSLKKLLFAGRLISYKGVDTILNAWNRIDNKDKKGWELEFIGNGPLADAIQKAGFKVLPFLQLNELSNYFQKSNAFYLGSYQENWGVAVHDAAACGLPLVLSNNVLAGDVFLENEKNGFVFTAGDDRELAMVLKKLFALDAKQMEDMELRSFELSKKVSVEKWLGVVENFIKISFKN